MSTLGTKIVHSRALKNQVLTGLDYIIPQNFFVTPTAVWRVASILLCLQAYTDIRFAIFLKRTPQRGTSTGFLHSPQSYSHVRNLKGHLLAQVHGAEIFEYFYSDLRWEEGDDVLPKSLSVMVDRSGDVFSTGKNAY